MEKPAKGEKAAENLQQFLERFEKSTDRIIREAMDRGEFDNLPNKGKPLDLSEDPFEDPDLRTAHRILKNSGFSLPFIEHAKALDRSMEAARTQIARVAREKDARRKARLMSGLRAVAKELNDQIRLFNLKAPSTSFHKPLLDLERELRKSAP